MNNFADAITRVETSPRRRGRQQLLRHLKGQHLTASERIKAKCNECCCGFVDGAIDCKLETCPLYPLRPYQET